MKENKNIQRKTLFISTQHDCKEEFQKMGQEDRELYLFLRGGLAAK